MKVMPTNGFQTYKKQNFGTMPSRDMIIAAADELFRDSSSNALNVLLVDMHLQQRGGNHIKTLLDTLEYYTSLPKIKELLGIERMPVASVANRRCMGSLSVPKTTPTPAAI